MNVNTCHTGCFPEICVLNMPKISGYARRTGILFLLLLGTVVAATAQYQLKITPVDKDSVFVSEQLKLQTSFANQVNCLEYVNDLPALLQLKGYPAASVDSLAVDSTTASIHLFIGAALKLALIRTDSIGKATLEESGGAPAALLNKALNAEQLQQWQEKILDYFENNGYPFAKIWLDSLNFTDEKLEASLKIDKGPLYSTDSIRVYGDVSINNRFLQRYLDIKNGEPYKKKKLQNISKKILELPYLQQLQPWDMTMLGTGAVINLYLKPKKSNQVNVLVGFLPANQTPNNIYEQQVRTKLLFTGEANINLRNAFGAGESLGLNWQQLQQQSPRLNLYFQQPYLLGSAFGVTTSFDFYKKDSSFVNLNFLLGMQYALSVNQTGKVFIQTLRTNINNVDTVNIKLTRRLPNEIDVSSVNVGVDYDINKTNYRLNPKKGFEWQWMISVGTRKIRKNNAIVKLSDGGFSYSKLYDTLKLNSYQFRLKSTIAKYFQLTKQSTFKTAVSGGWFQSPNAFRNELFQIGGYKLMRGFDEESIFASQYLVGTLEYRYLIGLNSFFFVFADYGQIENKTVNVKVNNNFLGLGLGMAFETKAGVFNISYAAGKRNDVKFDVRQSKIHFGYVSYF
jgi:outer membrane protein assembly factor BamA